MARAGKKKARRARKGTREENAAIPLTNLQQREWTIMLYLSGDNNLSEEMVRALNEITSRGVPEGCAFTIQYDPRSPCYDTFRYAITPEGPTKRGDEARPPQPRGPLPIPDYLVESLRDEDSASPAVLGEFIAWSARRYDSRRRMLILSGHGGGAVGEFLYDEDVLRGQPGSLTIPELAQAFCWARKRLPGVLDDKERLLQVLGLDSCLMSTAEVGYELREHVEYLVGSEGYVTNAGWPYGHLLMKLKERARAARQHPADPTKRLTPGNISRWLVEDCVKYYEHFIPAGVSIDIAACDLRPTRALVQKVRDLTDCLGKHVRKLEPGDKMSDEHRRIRDMVLVAHWRAQSYHLEQYTDLWDFCDQLRDAAQRDGGDAGGELAKACQAVMDVIRKGVVKASQHSGIEFQHSHGLSVYFPWSVSPLDGDAKLETYGALAFGDRSGWHTFLNGYLEATRREPLPMKGPTLLLDAFATRGEAPIDVRAAPNVNKAAPNVNKAAPNVNKAAPNVNKAAPNVNKAAERVLRFAEVLMRLYSGPGMRLPWSMKNPPHQVHWRSTQTPPHV